MSADTTLPPSPVEADREAAKAMLEHAFRNVDDHALRDVVFRDIVEHFTNARIAALAAGGNHSCAACPVEARALGAGLHNLIGQLERGDSILDERARRKLADAKAALALWQPVLDAHFATIRPASAEAPR